MTSRWKIWFWPIRSCLSYHETRAEPSSISISLCFRPMKEQCDWWRRKLREVAWSCTRHVDNLLCLCDHPPLIYTLANLKQRYLVVTCEIKTRIAEYLAKILQILQNLYLSISLIWTLMCQLMPPTFLANLKQVFCVLRAQWTRLNRCVWKYPKILANLDFTLLHPFLYCNNLASSVFRNSALIEVC